MAQILRFPADRPIGFVRQVRKPIAPIGPSMSGSGAEEWHSDDALDLASLEMIKRLGTSPSATLDELTGKVAILVARLADDEADAGLCTAEAQLLLSVLADLRVFAANSKASY